MQQFQFILFYFFIVYTYTQILLYIGCEVQSLVITMSSCSAQCIPWSRGSGWVEITRRICTMLYRLTSSSLQATAKMEGDSKKPVSQEELSRDQTSTVIAFNHIKRNSSLILRCKTIFLEVVPKSARHFDNGAEVSWVRSVLDPKCLYTFVTHTLCKEVV